jgi:hypothetical protein
MADEEFRFVRIMRDVDDVLRREVITPRALQIAVREARQTFRPPEDTQASTHLLIFTGTVVFGDDERDELNEVEQAEGILGNLTDRTSAVRLRDPNSMSGPDRVVGSASFVGEASMNNTSNDSYGIKVENAAVRTNSDDVYLLSNVGSNREGELARMAYQATVLERLGDRGQGRGTK